MHTWGNKDVDWKGIDDVATYLATFCRRWGRLGGQTKEKFGTVRFYASFGWISLHTLVYPGYVYSQFPKWLWDLDCYYIAPVLQFLFTRPFIKWQHYIYKEAYKNALRNWPHLREEILRCADWPELLEGV